MPGTYPPNMPNAVSEVYKTVDGVELEIYIFTPEGHAPTDSRPGIVFFFGGGFRNGSPEQFEKHCEHFAARGLVAMTADYRVASRHDTEPIHSVRDGKSAMRWVRANAGRLGVDPERIAAGGGSAGGLVAACAGVVEGVDEAGEDAAISSAADAMVLFNPAWMGTDCKRLAESEMPYHHIREGLPPSIMMFGTDDHLLAGAEEFHEAAQAKGDRSELLLWEGKGHGFFNYGRDLQTFTETLEAADRFLVSVGYLSGEPVIEVA